MSAMEEAGSFHFEIDMKLRADLGGLIMEVPIAYGGDYQAPDRTHVTLSMSFLGFATEIDVITIGDTTYVSESESGEWVIQSGEDEELLLFGPREFIALKPSDLKELTLIGMETLDGVAVYHLRGQVSGETIGELAGSPEEIEGELQVEYWIGLDDSRLRQIALNRYFPDGIQCFHKHIILRQSRL